MPYSALDSVKIIATIDRLSQRIHERFPGSSLWQVSREVHDIASKARQRATEISRPFWKIRILVGAAALAVLVISGIAFSSIKWKTDGLDGMEFIQVLDAGLNDVIVIAAAILFIATLEIRIKRRRALAAIHEIRSIAHIIDMHQLTKDPERYAPEAPVPTKASPVHAMSRRELGRYLDYCSELLSLCGKIAALYVQDFDDATAIASTNDVELLCTGLSRKIWQKIMILESLPTKVT